MLCSPRLCWRSHGWWPRGRWFIRRYTWLGGTQYCSYTAFMAHNRGGRSHRLFWLDQFDNSAHSYARLADYARASGRPFGRVNIYYDWVYLTDAHAAENNTLRLRGTKETSTNVLGAKFYIVTESQHGEASFCFPNHKSRCDIASTAAGKLHVPPIAVRCDIILLDFFFLVRCDL